MSQHFHSSRLFAVGEDCVWWMCLPDGIMAVWKGKGIESESESDVLQALVLFGCGGSLRREAAQA